MKLKIIALATTLALTSTFALAQSSTGGATSGTAATTDTTGPTGRPSGDAAMQKNMGTIGTSKQGQGASEQGAGTAASVNAKGDSTEPGNVKDGKTR